MNGTTCTVHRDGAEAAIWRGLAPEGLVPDHITASVTLLPLNRYTGHIAVLWYGINAKTGKRHQRRTSHVYAFTDNWLCLFSESDVKALLTARECR